MRGSYRSQTQERCVTWLAVVTVAIVVVCALTLLVAATIAVLGRLL